MVRKVDEIVIRNVLNGKTKSGVCMLTYAFFPEHSGAALQAFRLASHLRQEGVEIFFVSQCDKKENMKNKVVDGFEVLRIYKGNLFAKIFAPWRFFWSLFQNRHRFQIIHIHGVGYIAYLAIFFAQLFRKKTIVKMTMFGEDDALTIKQTRLGFIHFWFFKRASAYIAITRNFQESCLNAGISADKIFLIPNAVDTFQFFPVSREKKLALRKSLGLPETKKILVYAGLIRKMKGIDFLLEVISKLGEERSDIFFVLLGPIERWIEETECDYIQAFHVAIKDLTSKGIVSYRGNVVNVGEYFQAADIFVSAAKQEGFPNVLLEAMATGLFPIVVNIPGVYEHFLGTGENGLIVFDRDPNVFVRVLISVLSDPVQFDSVARTARRKIEETCSFEKTKKKYVNLYQAVIKDES